MRVLSTRPAQFLWLAVTFASWPGAAVLRSQGPDLGSLESHFASYQGTRVHYKGVGSGPTAVVFVHGWSCDMSVWAAQLPAVAGKTRALFIDLPGFGQSDKPQVAYTMDYLAGGIEAVMREAGVERAVLVGHSMGTPVIRQFYRRRPDAVIGLVAVDGALRSYFNDTVATRQFVSRLEGGDYASKMGSMMGGMISTMADSAAKVHVLRVAVTTPQRVAVSSMRGMMDPSIWGDDQIHVPMLAVMAGSSGWTTDYETYVKRLVPGVRYVTLPRVGHFLMIERPTDFNALLTSFLGDQHLIH